VFDQHDLNPELFRSRFGEPKGLAARAQLGVLRWLERMTYRVADHVIVTNGSYRQIAMGRGERASADVTVVRSGPDTRRMRPVPGEPQLRKGAGHLLAYLGIMGPQDNVDVLLDVMDDLVRRQGRTDVHLVLMGFGDCLEELRARSLQLGLGAHVTFTGRVDQQKIARYLSTASLGLSPDLKTPLNDVSTHNKTMEYMAFALPVVSFDLLESRRSSGDASVYVPNDDVTAFAEAVSELLDDPDRRVEMSRLARSRCVRDLDWYPQSQAYVEVFENLVGAEPVVVPELISIDRRTTPGPLPELAGSRVIDLRDPVDFETFLRHRSGAPVGGPATPPNGTRMPSRDSLLPE
jgi:glycosyltransferase involved in cell wall biosynthesis